MTDTEVIVALLLLVVGVGILFWMQNYKWRR